MSRGISPGSSLTDVKALSISEGSRVSSPILHRHSRPWHGASSPWAKNQDSMSPGLHKGECVPNRLHMLLSEREGGYRMALCRFADYMSLYLGTSCGGKLSVLYGPECCHMSHASGLCIESTRCIRRIVRSYKLRCGIADKSRKVGCRTEANRPKRNIRCSAVW